MWNRHAGVNRYRKYAVTVMDHWTPMRLFWTLRGAKKWRATILSGSHLYHWSDMADRWMEL